MNEDLLSIRHKRYRERRCVNCGGACSNGATLCAVCATSKRFCPLCMKVWAAPPPRKRRRISDACWQCRHTQKYGHAPTPQAIYQAQLSVQRKARLQEIIALYRRGMPMRRIAEQMEINLATLRLVVYRARKAGEWPEKLRRKRE